MLIFSPHVAYWVALATIFVFLAVFSLRLFLPWAKRHWLTSMIVSPPSGEQDSKKPTRVTMYVHGENKRGATEPAPSIAPEPARRHAYHS
jgi:hypothetical protein